MIDFKKIDILTIIKLFIPNFHNRIVLILVISGVSIMTTPLWVDLINFFLKKQYNYSLTGEKDEFWGFMLCLLGSIYGIFTNISLKYVDHKEYKYKRQEEKNELSNKVNHDKGVFINFDKILSEEKLNSFLNYIRTNDALMSNHTDMLEDSLVFLRMQKNNFLIREIEDSKEILISSIDEFLRFHCENFDMWPYHQTGDIYRTCLEPTLNVDRGGKWEDGRKYDLLVNEMLSKLKNLESSYNEFRNSIKNNIFY